MKTAEFAAAQKDVTSTRAEMEELLDSHQGVVHKMKTLQVRQHARGVGKIQIDFSFYEMTANISNKNIFLRRRKRAPSMSRCRRRDTRWMKLPLQ